MTRSTIRYGSRGTDVKAWQRILGVNDDGIFGRQTEGATKDWQKTNGLVADGIVGPRTWAAAASVSQIKAVPPKVATVVTAGTTIAKTQTVRLGSKGSSVVAVQKILGVSPTGIFDSKTRSAVIAFQKARGLKPDGIVGVNTWKALRAYTPAASKPAAKTIVDTAPKTTAAKTTSLSPAQKKQMELDEESRRLKLALQKEQQTQVASLNDKTRKLSLALNPNTAIKQPKPTITAPKIVKSIPTNTIRQGSKGALVKEWQEIIGATVDGVFGSKTAAMTKAWQSTHGLVADGIVGPNTWAKAHALGKQKLITDATGSGILSASMVPPGVQDAVESVKSRVSTWPTWKKVAFGLLILGGGALGIRRL